MSPAEREALIVRAKRLAVPVASCVRAGVSFGHLIDGLSAAELLALVTVLGECADPVRLKAVTAAPGDTGMPPESRESVLRRANAEYERLCRAGLDVPYEVRLLRNEYRRECKLRREAATEESDAA